MGEAVIAAMGFTSGFTHMEWYRTAAGEVVFGEIGARAPGARLTDLMNYSCDIDLFTGWAEAVCHGRFSQPVERRYNAAMVIKRAQGQGRITHVEGLAHLMATMGEHIVNVDLVGDRPAPPGLAGRPCSPTASSSSATPTWRRPTSSPTASAPSCTSTPADQAFRSSDRWSTPVTVRWRPASSPDQRDTGAGQR